MIADRVAARDRLDALTSMRFVAAFCIVAMHLGGHFGLPSDMTFDGRMPLHQGVSFFFVLSGFIMTYVYPTLDSWGERSRFLIARVARVWPAHLVATLFAILVAVHYAGQWIELRPLVANLLMIHAWIPREKYFFSGNLVSWSVSTEWGFYLFFLLLILQARRRWPLYVLASLLVALGLIGICIAFDLPYSRPRGITSNGLLYMNPIARLFEFSCGVGAACAWKKYGPMIKMNSAWATLIELLAVFLVFTCAYFSTPWAGAIGAAIGVSRHFAFWFSSGGFSAIPFALLIFVLAMQRGILSRVLAFRLFVILGDISYGMYLLHFSLLGVFYYQWHQSSASKPVLLFSYIACLLLLSFVMWRWIETPCRRWIVSFHRK